MKSFSTPSPGGSRVSEFAGIYLSLYFLRMLKSLLMQIVCAELVLLGRHRVRECFAVALNSFLLFDSHFRQTVVFICDNGTPKIVRICQFPAATASSWVHFDAGSRAPANRLGGCNNTFLGPWQKMLLGEDVYKNKKREIRPSLSVCWGRPLKKILS